MQNKEPGLKDLIDLQVDKKQGLITIPSFHLINQLNPLIQV
jgi:hypothetical protein